MHRKKIPEVRKGPLPTTVTLAVRESLYGRKGWMVMPLAGNSHSSPDMRNMHPKDLERIYDDLNSMERAGEDISNHYQVELLLNCTDVSHAIPMYLALHIIFDNCL